MKITLTAYRSIVVIVLVTACILLGPLLAMQMTGDVAWSIFDFAVAASLLISAGLVVDLVARTVSNNAARAALVGVLAVVLFLVWAELAVGIFGTAFAGS